MPSTNPKVDAMLRKFYQVAIASAVLCLTACHGAHLETPSGFAEVDGGKFDYRASTAEGVMVGVKSHPNDPRGSLDFWSSVLSHKLEAQGYHKDGGEPRKVKSDHGLEGRQLRYTLDEGGRPHKYWLTLFVTPSRVYVVEAGGDEAFFDKAVAPKVETAIATLETG